jgi:hypothetical protein
MQNREELRQKGTIGLKNNVSREGKNIIFRKMGGGDNCRFWIKI